MYRIRKHCNYKYKEYPSVYQTGILALFDESEQGR